MLVRGEMVAGATWQRGAMRPRGERVAGDRGFGGKSERASCGFGAEGRRDCDARGDEYASGGPGSGDDEAAGVRGVRWCRVR